MMLSVKGRGLIILVLIAIVVILTIPSITKRVSLSRVDVVNETCLHRSFEIIEEYCQYDPRSHIMAVYIQNTGLRRIEPSLIIVNFKDLEIRKRLNETKVSVPRDSSTYLYINLSEFLGENGEATYMEGPERIEIVDKCANVIAKVSKPPLGWSFFTYKGEEPLI